MLPPVSAQNCCQISSLLGPNNVRKKLIGCFARNLCHMRRERSITNGHYFWIIHAGSRITADVSNRARRVAANRLRAGSRIAGLLANSCPVLPARDLSEFTGLSLTCRPAPCNCVIYGACPVLPCNLRGCRDGVFPARG